ncbi:uncharacterized protein LOC113296586 [Papaver somniferum]|uniref:uncharacterized protein LOC113296586 n=1 Tax=Papaver somniferum TaxID=3469 RepID=UPI000E6F59CD|nr:uncharacterized protein LOC113296586 [Papaver somniferum]
MTHFSTIEEEALIYGWVIASNDPIHGKDQKGAIFWGKIMEEYNKRKAHNGVERDRKALSYRRGRENYVATTKKQWTHESIFQILKTYQPDYNPAVNNDDGVGTSTQPSQHTQATEENEVDNLDEEFQNMARFGSSSSTHNSKTSDISKRRRYFEQTDDVRSEGRDQAKKRAREAKASHKSDEKLDKLIELLENAQTQRMAKYETEEEYLKKDMENSSILAQTQQRESDMKILRQPLDELQEWEKPVYKIWKNEILSRHGLPLIP